MKKHLQTDRTSSSLYRAFTGRQFLARWMHRLGGSPAFQRRVLCKVGVALS